MGCLGVLSMAGIVWILKALLARPLAIDAPIRLAIFWMLTQLFDAMGPGHSWFPFAHAIMGGCRPTPSGGFTGLSHSDP